MHIHRIEFGIPDGQTSESVTDFARTLLGALRMSGQICGAEWPVYTKKNRCVTTGFTPEFGSLDTRFNGKYVAERIREGALSGITVTAVTEAEDCCSAGVCSCKSPCGYVLFTNYLSVESPVRCIDCFMPVPLYRFPAMPGGEYHEIISWQSDYQSCDSLQMNCTVLVRAATRQMSDLRSSLSVVGRGNCRILEDLSGKPFYYYLYRTNARSVRSEKERPCPSCGQPWYLETPLHFFHYKCDPCRLLSNFAWNIKP